MKTVAEKIEKLEDEISKLKDIIIALQAQLKNNSNIQYVYVYPAQPIYQPAIPFY